MARQTARRRAWIGIAIVAGLVALSAGAWGVKRWEPFADDTEVSWPENIQPLAEYVENETRMKFIDSVNFQFISADDEYARRVAVDQPAITDDDRAVAAVDEAVGRALGLWAGDASLLETRQLLAEAPQLPATWLPDENTIVINYPNERFVLSAGVRALLVLVLTQVLDNQLFATVERGNRESDAQRLQSLIALDVGHALWVRDHYIDDFDDDERQAYDEDDRARLDEYRDSTSRVPVAYRSLRLVAQQLGPMFIEAMREQDLALVADALSADLPQALDQVSLPTSKYLRRDHLEDVSTPPGPSDAEVHYSNQLGPFALYLLMSTGLAPNVALTASDGWGNDRYTAYTLDDRVCVDLHFVADSRDDADRIEAGFDGWANARPAAADALVARDGTDLYVSVCDPGTDARQLVPSDDVVSHYFGRASMIREYTDNTGKPDLAECIAVTFYAMFTQREMDSFDPDVDVFAELDTIEDDCRNSE